MASTEAMRLFVKILEVRSKLVILYLITVLLNKTITSQVCHFSGQEEDPGWYSRASHFVSEPVVDVEMHVRLPFHNLSILLFLFLLFSRVCNISKVMLMYFVTMKISYK